MNPSGVSNIGEARPTHPPAAEWNSHQAAAPQGAGGSYCAYDAYEQGLPPPRSAQPVGAALSGVIPPFTPVPGVPSVPNAPYGYYANQSVPEAIPTGPLHEAPQTAQQKLAAASEEQEGAHACIVAISRQGLTNKLVNNGTIPRLTVQERELDAARRPPPGSHWTAVSPVSVRPTLSVLPSSPSELAKISLPIAFVVQPLAERRCELGDVSDVTVPPDSSQPGLPLVDPVTMNVEANNRTIVIRCRRCRAYINPYCVFTDGGRRWQCCICHSFSDVPKRYFCELNTNGIRTDIATRLELTNATCEFIAPQDYMVRAPQRPVFLFLMDVSNSAVQSGMLAHQCQGILDAVTALKGDDSVFVSFVAYDATVYLFNLRSSQASPKMIAAPDLAAENFHISEQSVLEPIELPAVLDDLVVSLVDSYSLVVALLEKLPSLFEKTTTVDCVLGPALATAVSMLSPTGGKIIVSLSAMPCIGDGRLSTRSCSKLYGHSKESSLCEPATKWYQQLALACSLAQISVDIAACLPGSSTASMSPSSPTGAAPTTTASTAELDLASIVPIARYTSGHVYLYTIHNIHGVRGDMKRALMRDTAFEAVLRIRASPQLQPSQYYGHFYVRGGDLLTLPMCDSDTTYGIQFAMAGAISSAFAYVQIALLYTTRSRERRIRVSTMQLPVTQSMSRVFNNADCGAIALMLARSSVDRTLTSTFTSLQHHLNEKMLGMLKYFLPMARVRSSSGGSQLVLPESLKHLPLIMAGFLRCPACRTISTIETTPDERVANASQIMLAPIDSFLSMCLSWLFCLYSPSRATQPNSADAHLEQYPSLELASIDSLHPDSIFLFDIGTAMAIWVGRAVPPRIIRRLRLQEICMPGAADNTPGMLDGTEGGSDDGASDAAMDALANRIVSLVEKQAALSKHVQCSVPPLLIVQGQPASATAVPSASLVHERHFYLTLVEDEAKESASYGTYIQNLARKVIAPA